jgi:N-methylhydantoinase A/oxoprolinase/acetone carboxylase beta subunit
MAEAARVHSVEVNVDIRRYAMVAFGGAGPIHAVGVARRLGVVRVICPLAAGVLSAWGLLTGPLAFEFARSSPSDLDSSDLESVEGLLRALEAEGTRLLVQANVNEIKVERSVDMCYVGQRYEVTTPLPRQPLTRRDREILKNTFDEAYESAYGRSLRGLPARCVTWRVLTTGPTPDSIFAIDETATSNGSIDASPSPIAARRVIFSDHGAYRCPVYSATTLAAGAIIEGPALIEAQATTIVVPPFSEASMDNFDNVIIRVLAAAPSTT